MGMKLRHVASMSLVSLVALSLTGCSRNKPSETDVAASLQQILPGYVLSDLECESFADRNQEGTGRTSCRGTIAPDQDLYSSLEREEAQSLLVAAGIPFEGGAYFAKRHPQQILRLSVNRGVKTPLTTDCVYRRNVDAWQIGCTPNFDQFVGHPLAASGSDAVVQDSPEYKAYVGRVLSDFRDLKAPYEVIKGQVERFFSPGRTVSIFNHYVGDTPVMQISISSSIVWTGPKGFLGYQSAFSMDSQMQASGDSVTRTFCGYTRGIPNNVVRLVGNIFASSSRQKEQGAGPFTASLEIFEPFRLFQNQFRGCGTSVIWNGTSFGGGTTRALEIRSR